MRKFLFTILTFNFFSVSLFAQQKEYKLGTRTNNADINKLAILLLDTTTTSESVRNAFNPTKGKYNVSVFIATFKGLSYNNTEKEFHDIVVLKTDKNNKVLEAYQYTLEWAEMPLTADLYKASAKGVTLINGLPIEKLLFRRVEPVEGVVSKLDDQGILTF